MINKLQTPIDKKTGMPLPIFPSLEVPSFDRAHEANWHHHYHPKVHHWLTSEAGLPVRHLRLQKVPLKTHNKYHDIFIGPKLPRTITERFGHIVLACAGYIPEYAVDPTNDDPTEPVPLSDRQRSRLRTSGEIVVHGQNNIAAFMKDYVVKQDLSHVKEELIEEFVFTKNQQRKWFLGHWLLAQATEIATEPLESMYLQAKQEGLVDYGTKIKLPNLVKAHLNGKATAPKAVKHLHSRLKKVATETLQTEVDELELAA